MTTPNREGVVALNIITDKLGRTWISIDSLVDMFGDMASDMTDGPAKNFATNLCETFRPGSSYAEPGHTIEDSDDGSMMAARHCACGAVVIDAQSLSGDPVLIDAAPVPDGELFPFKVMSGVPTVGPYSEKLDGAGIEIRLHAHACAATS